MIIHILPGAERLGALAARHIEVALLGVRRPVLGVATGSSPEPVYAALADRASAGTFRVDSLRAFALDEYVGLPDDHAERYRNVLLRAFADPLGIDDRSVHVPDGGDADPSAAAEAYERAIHLAGGIDLQLLGIGRNGHIGFNEPGSDFRSLTRVVELADSTRVANARFFADRDEVPRHSISQGLATIMRARAALLIATGAAKAEAVRAALTGPVTTDLPASVLQRHPALSVYLDGEAASALDLHLLESIAVVHDWRA
ncbi:glucosamine-6-phosphate deaminase [Agromyces fucosus]|uniref:Glucosamine-6-phosphate deaminase n=1 Tax=Agromyces fucosus TaxID=41985 RepID=A0A4Q2JKR8_9MICO|nr:glucosamine-6-phosphate deaminase [Agromyces fucosus]RXZ48701.1 glucosamine-6-phosphate deaminase [Agromyces fucosus]